jgi:predicted RNase H-like nuclease (RuvC/YqgF family)
MVYYLLRETVEEKVRVLNDLLIELISFSEKEKRNNRDLERLKENQRKLHEKLKNMEMKIEELSLKMKKSLTLKENLNTKKENLLKEIEDTRVIDVIFVDEERNKKLWNGLVTLNRDILMRLMKLIHEENKIRNVLFSFHFFRCLFFLRLWAFQKHSMSGRNKEYSVGPGQVLIFSTAVISFSFLQR